jgi:lipopolysaccharide export system protein LptA
MTRFLSIYGLGLGLMVLSSSIIYVDSNIAQAQEVTKEGAGGAIELEAEDGIEWLRNEKRYIATGNAIAKRGGVTIKADELIAHYNEDADGNSQAIYRLDAIGHVVITSGQTEATGDKGVYHMDKKVAVLVGKNLQLISPRALITAEDSLEYWEERELAVARGKATVIQKDKRLQAGVLTAYIRPDKKTGKKTIQRIDATGGVHISTKREIIRGAEAVYNVAEEKATICGNVKITRGENQLNGECADVNMKTGRSRLRGGKGKVKGLILPTR